MCIWDNFFQVVNSSQLGLVIPGVPHPIMNVNASDITLPNATETVLPQTTYRHKEYQQEVQRTEIADPPLLLVLVLPFLPAYIFTWPHVCTLFVLARVELHCSLIVFLVSLTQSCVAWILTSAHRSENMEVGTQNCVSDLKYDEQCSNNTEQYESSHLYLWCSCCCHYHVSVGVVSLQRLVRRCHW